MPQLDFSTYAAQIVWLALIFSMLYLFIARFVAPSIDSIIARRDDTRDSDLSRADRAEKDAATAETAWKKALTDARTQATERLQHASLVIKEKEAHNAQQLAARIQAKERESEANVLALQKELAAEFPRLASDVARDLLRKIANKNVSDADISSKLTSVKGSL